MLKKQIVRADNKTFQCIRNIGEGGSGNVYICHDEADIESPLAIKIIKKDKNNDIFRFKEEINFQKTANNKYIVPCLYEGKTKNEESFYIMPFYEKTLRDLMKGESTNIQKLEWFLDVCEAVKFTHSNGIVHRDIKPENIMMGENNLVLGDFGIAHFQDKPLTEKGDRLANFIYHAPEQKYNSRKKIGFGTDIYALGLILNELFTGVLPIGVDSKRIRDVSPIFGFLDDIVSTCLLMILTNEKARYKT